MILNVFVVCVVLYLPKINTVRKLPALRSVVREMKIKNIVDAGIEPVYNMEVEDVHCYPVTDSDIIVHNCDALRYLCMKLKAKTKLDNVTKKVGW